MLFAIVLRGMNKKRVEICIWAGLQSLPWICLQIRKLSMKIYHVDAFTAKAFKGNPAAVCLLEYPKVDTWMQSVAMEMNLSETAFLIRQGDGYNLRWFTPKVEVDLCGHGTLASAHVLFGSGGARHDAVIRFYTRSGLLTAVLNDGWIELNFPSTPDAEVSAPEGLTEALGIEARYIGKTQFDYIVEVGSEEIVRNMDPDFNALCRVQTRGIIVTSRADSGEFDFISRFFCPVLGIREDPVTGSAHCCLGPYWAKKLNKNNLVAYQASERGGMIRVRVDGDRIYLSGQAVTVLKAELLI
jgi:PhzF family phenazine biosynthesis protein